MKTLLLGLTVLTMIGGIGCSRKDNPVEPFTEAQMLDERAAEIKRKMRDYEARRDELVARIEAHQEKRNAQISALQKSWGEKSEQQQRRISRTLLVPDEYPTIQQAVEAALPRDKIIVKSGTYNETVSIYKPNLKIIAANDSGVRVFGAFEIWQTSGVIIQGFQIHGNAGVPALSAWQCTRVEFRNNTIVGAAAGIDLHLSSCCVLKKNRVSNSDFGIFLYKSERNLIQSNQLRDNLEAGISNLFGNLNIFSGNIAVGNIFAGIDFGNSNGNRACGTNYFNNNSFGCVLSRSNNNVMTSKNFANANLVFGIWIDAKSNDNVLVNFTARNNEYDINLEPGNTGNKFFQCNFGVCYGNCPFME